VIVVSNIAIDFLLDLSKRMARTTLYMVFHVTEEGLLRGIIPAVSPSRHGLAKPLLLQQLLVDGTRIMATLVGMDKGLGVKLHTSLFHQQVDRVCDEGEMEACRQVVREEFPCGCIQNGR
jgi:hypothetical protein